MHIPDIFQYLCEFRVCGLFSFHIQNEFVAKFVVTTDYVIYLVTCSFVKHMLLYFSDDCVCNIFIVQFSLLYLRNISLCSVPRMLSLLFGTYILICIRQDATLCSLFIFGNCSTCFGWYLHPSSGAHTTVSTASGACQTVTATCCYHGRVETSSNSSTIAAGSSNGLTSARCCRYSCVCS